MCLTRITKKVRSQKKLAMKQGAWAVLHLDSDGMIYTPCKYKKVNVGRRMKAEPFGMPRVYIGKGSYQFGFHKYATEEGAKNSWLMGGNRFICPVELTGVRTEGVEDGGYVVFVADEMIVHRADLVKALWAAKFPVPKRYLTKRERCA